MEHSERSPIHMTKEDKHMKLIILKLWRVLTCIGLVLWSAGAIMLGDAWLRGQRRGLTVSDESIMQTFLPQESYLSYAALYSMYLRAFFLFVLLAVVCADSLCYQQAAIRSGRFLPDGRRGDLLLVVLLHVAAFLYWLFFILMT